ncbi:uncharacterized protein EV420DRAFT_1531262 [Desarmillaria tabescens]|uniref:Uncharacterized protein n=1 Tax=Armillaria tabescens TaxID=1929756 RepID=A0AA39N938_ARMTA|nr:uncharacterized protein EV420DRAFT_1531262 [Desarmillaria tabescens]KAK0461283.1 hypothetical protein EV420DRAFT_1531262 [Desarmillaria tabescens]
MIILEEADQQAKLDSSVAGPTLRFPDRAVGRSSSPLPDYETSQAQHNLTPTRKSLHSRVDARFWRATLYALVIYVVLSVVIGVPLIVTRLSKKHRGPPGPWPNDDSISPQSLGNNAVLSLETVGCNTWDTIEDDPLHSLFSASTSHTLLPSGSISIRSNVSIKAVDAAGIAGNLTVDINPDSSADVVLLLVSLQSSSLNLRQRTHVCFSDTGSDRGVSLYVPNHLDDAASLSVAITLLFPQTSSAINIDYLATYLPMFTQVFGDFGDNISFSKVSIEGASMGIICDFMQAPKIAVKNALASISGTFNASENLKLDTVGGPIYANITLVQDKDRHHPTFFSLDTGNSEIDASVVLLAPNRYNEPLNFIGRVQTFNGPLTLDVSHDSSTPPVPLDLHVQNTQAESNVTLDSKYIGLFDVQTKLANVAVKESRIDSSWDPAGENRSRMCEYDQTSSNRVRGWIGWGQRPTNWKPRDGRVQVVSSLSPVHLHLAGPSEGAS